MSVLQTATKRLENQTIKQWFVSALEGLVDNPNTDLYDILKNI